MLPRQAQKSGSGQSLLLAQQQQEQQPAAATPLYPTVEESRMAAADVQTTYNVAELDTLINKAREDMERAAKSLDFLAAARYRDRMYELQKLKEEAR